jgi:hypothetical protein
MQQVTLGASPTASRALLINDQAVTLDFSIAVTGPATITFFLEFSENATATSGDWFAEVAEEDAGKGVVSMPKVVRTFADNNSTAVATNAAFNVSCQFTRQAPFVRVQMAVSAGAAVVNLTAPFGTPV